MTTRISKLLIANRGEIACRVMRSARRLGIETVAVYSEADKNALHVAMADEAHCIGPAASQASYLNVDRIMETIHRSGSQAVHPGYGFLSENTEFAERLAREGVVFVGPPASAIRDMGIKNTSKVIMSEAGVPVIEGYHGEEQSTERLLAESRRIGFPVMIKAVRGGGGKGMRIALSEADFVEQLESARREARKSFDDEAMLVERFIERPRHVEVQVFGDTHGNVVYLFERDCSVQRRHQKVIEEAPAPGLDEERRRVVGEAAVRAAKAVGYVGAGTVEFVMDAEQRFFFMEMNTRLQVEHPITEMITGVDLVEWQLRVAAGEPLPLRQDELRLQGHALEARVYAEDTALGFIPTAGRVRHLSGPAAQPGVRVDSGVRSGDDISVHYDPMIAKLVVHAHDRRSALRRLSASLADFHVAGLPTNVAFLRSLAAHPAFDAADVHTGFIEQHRDSLMNPVTPALSDDALLQAGVALALLETKPQPRGPWATLHGFRVNADLVRSFGVAPQEGGAWTALSVALARDGAMTVRWDGQDARRRVRAGLRSEAPVADGTDARLVVSMTEEGEKGARTTEFAVVPPEDGELNIFDAQRHLVLRLQPPSFLGKAVGGGTETGRGDAKAPMPGVVEKVLVNEGDNVEEGQALVTMIAMKMEYTIRAGAAGRIAKVLCAEGDTVKKGGVLVAFAKEGEEVD